MANALYRQLPDGSWANQANGGGPVLFRIQQTPASNGSGGFMWDIAFTWNGEHWFYYLTPATTQAGAQATLNDYMADMNAGTA